MCTYNQYSKNEFHVFNDVESDEAESSASEEEVRPANKPKNSIAKAYSIESSSSEKDSDSDEEPPPSPPRRRVSLPIPMRANLLVPDLTCPIDHLRPQHIYGYINTALKALGYLGVYTFDLFVQSKALDGGAIDMLRRSGVEVHISQPPTKTKKKSNANHKGFPDYELGKAMHSWALERNPSPVLLISSDSRLRTDVSHIKSLRFEIILFHTKKAPKDLKDLCTKYALWFNGVAELT
ncbi:uncharacterized protein LOC9313510 [Arabidopsis lyrata subsp. lyrata]|uniref:uncharacterized protein LOC9313510 n=1 Tax=Arabidopsis lyrata subsp. lyrata TaxID=81972 RepID=UPI000A29C192|nr:uncharacterized protein LOC9313510 [Arabidopsis lyrata subsp. lyrata]|eukprot:XP_020881836.1 uncharacterized protein LOC9313510 [Arabidopsis lyrata subsp. lyrata]